MRLLLVRHGQTTSNVGQLLDTAFPGADLDELGRRQAAALVHRLAEARIDAIAVSNLVRTAQTAAPVAAHRSLTPVVFPGLREISAGEDEMSPLWQRYVATLVGWADDPTLRLPGGESGLEFLARYDEAIDEIAALGHDHVMVVSHGAAIRTWAGHRVPGLAGTLGHGGVPNTTVIQVEGSAADGWELVSIDVPDGAR